MQCILNRHGLLEATAARTAYGGTRARRPHGGVPGPAADQSGVLDVIGEAAGVSADYATARRSEPLEVSRGWARSSPPAHHNC